MEKTQEEDCKVFQKLLSVHPRLLLSSNSTQVAKQNDPELNIFKVK
jgi:hypothetical protein